MPSKYGALSNAVGSILIGWTIETAPAGKGLLLSWTEKGGPAVTPPAHKGFGSRVLERGLAHELEGTVQLRLPSGWTCLHDGYSLTEKVLVMDKLLSGRRVLVVEDEMLVLIMIEDMLADLGCRAIAESW